MNDSVDQLLRSAGAQPVSRFLLTLREVSLADSRAFYPDLGVCARYAGLLHDFSGMPTRIEHCYDPILEDQVIKSTPRNRQKDALGKEKKKKVTTDKTIKNSSCGVCIMCDDSPFVADLLFHAPVRPRMT